MKILAVDTATEACSAALLCDDKILSRFDDLPRAHTQQILPMVESLLAEAKIALTDLDAIAFGRGPGSFTGVRIGISVAQGLALGAELPLIGVSTLAAMAQGAYRRHGATQILSAIDARMGEVYFGRYVFENGIMQVQGAEAVLTPELLTQQLTTLTGAWQAIGTGFVTYPQLLEVENIQIDPCVGLQLPCAEDMLPLAVAAWQRGETLPVELAEPVYLRDTVTWKKLPGRE